jgi:hypothetical protein
VQVFAGIFDMYQPQFLFCLSLSVHCVLALGFLGLQNLEVEPFESFVRMNTSVMHLQFFLKVCCFAVSELIPALWVSKD